MEMIDIYDELGQKCGKTEENTRLIEKDLFIKVSVYGLLILMMRYYYKLEIVKLCSQI
ncbi:hypothetical protein K154306013_04570 [Clostridium tetani]|nr:hypothetical protein K154306013_04570 [Clostridium tetani]